MGALRLSSPRAALMIDSLLSKPSLITAKLWHAIACGCMKQPGTFHSAQTDLKQASLALTQRSWGMLSHAVAVSNLALFTVPKLT